MGGLGVFNVHNDVGRDAWPGRPDPLTRYVTAASGAASAERGLPSSARSRLVQAVKRTGVVPRNHRVQIVLRLVTVAG
jgi:hypothetical protein